jgi:hypothetical protein
MTTTEQQQAAAQFAEFWAGKGDEKQETSRFWIDLLQNVLGIANPSKYIEFEKRVKLSHTSFIDAYIPETKVLIEQKGAKIDLHKAYAQSDGSELTPYQQAKRYADEMPNSLRPRWIVVCNFQEFLVYDLEKPGDEPEQIFLKDLEKEYYRLQFLADSRHDYLRREEELSLQAGALVGKLYDALIKQYIDPDEQSLRSLNILCVRLVFCFYAEDAGLFATRTAFEDYLRSFAIENARKGLIDLFKALDTPLAQRDKYDTKLQPFPYVNGGLFRDEQIEIPNFTQEIIDVICDNCAPFNWSDISPTIFGAVFESTLNPETRRKGGMHYTSIANIHKVIDPLFLDDLNAEFETIVDSRRTTSQRQQLADFQKKLGSLKFLDPACGSGNFLTETYLSLRRLENRAILALNKGERKLGFDDFICVKISQFYGIEINDFAVTVAKTALWIAESQMIRETEAILSQNIDFLPLTTNAFIVEGNALRMDWATLKPIDTSAMPANSLFSGFTTETDGERHQYDYIIGNPPFVGYSYQSDEQKDDLHFVSKDIANNIDYVAGWYFKAAMLMNGTKTRAAFVSTNSITQGEQVAVLWKPLFEKYGVQIDFAWRTFRWDSESNQKAHVHCVIVGFSCRDALNVSARRIFNADGTVVNAKNINGYLLDASNIFIEKRKIPLSNVSKINKGSQPTDGGNLIIEADEYEDFMAKEPAANKFIHTFLGAEEFINKKKRYCLWLVNASPAELRKMPLVVKRIEAVKEMRLASPKEATRKWADYPYLFTENRQPKSGNYLLIPRVSSERREYIPIGYVSSEVIASDAAQLVPNATLYEFGILTSSVHNAWMRSVCGRLKSDYRYSNDIVYNNFPWSQESENTKAKIEQTAHKILDARALYPDSSLADLYDETLMPPELRKAHRENDKAVMAAYGFDAAMDESEIVARLFELYEAMVKK